MTNTQPFLSIIIPAYNEERRLPHTLADVMEFLARQSFSAEVLVVDDGSSDATAAISRRYQDIRLLQLDHRGKGFAVRTGALAARGEYVLLCDADLAVPLDEWPKLWDKISAGYDLAIGSREGVGAQREGEPWHRHLMGRVFNTIVRLVAIGGIQDTQCGFKAMSAQVAADLFRHMRIYGDDAPVLSGAAVTAYDVELLYLARRRGYRIAEVPVFWHYGAETKVNPLRDSARNLRDVLRVRLNALSGAYRDIRPIAQTEHSQSRR